MRNKKNARECKIELVNTLDINISINMAEISFSEEIKPPKEKYNRAKVKEEMRNKIKDWEERKIMSKKQKIIDYMKQHGSITQLEAMDTRNNINTIRLGGIIHYLRNKEGYNIKTEIVKSKNEEGETSYFARYSFIEEPEDEIMAHIPSLI